MALNLFNINLRKTGIYYFFLVFITILFPLFHYPRIYGVDAFQLMWMANALRDGALFSEHTWLIHPTSYFGYYPFSHRAIFIPIVLALLISLFEFISFGIFGIAEAILTLNIIFIFIIYKGSRNLAKTLFKEEWCRFLFVTTILFSFYVLNDITMTISTRMIITILMIFLLNLNLKILNNSINTFKAIILLFLLLLIGALSHRLWVANLITIVIMLFTYLIKKIKNLQKIIIFFIIPLCIIAFFIGLDILGTEFLLRLDPDQTFSPFFDEKTLLGMGVLISWFYVWNIGIIAFFFPAGVIITLYKLISNLKNFNHKNSQINKNHQFLQKYYLILFIIPFSFLIPYTFYSIVIFFPLLIIFSIYGIVYIKKVISRYSETLSWLLVAILLFISIVYSFIKVEVSTKIDLSFVYIFSIISLILFLFIFLINKNKIPNIQKISLNPLKKRIWILILTISLLVFSITTIETNRASMYSSPYPWENLCLTEEEIEIIDYFQNETINGLIFCTNKEMDNRLSGVAFLPTFYGRSYIGKALWYDLITTKEVIEYSIFSLSFSTILNQHFFSFRPEYATSYYETSPLEVLRRNIIGLNMTIEEDLFLLYSVYNIRYIISTYENIPHESNEWTLIQTLFQSELEPAFSTQHLLVWKIT